KGDPAVRLAGLRRGGLVAWENGRVVSVSGAPPGPGLAHRPEFASLGAVHPSRPLLLETPGASGPRTAEIQRVVDLVCPFGFGQRALIVSPPKAGKTVMLQAVAEAVAVNYPTATLLILLVDERPEEVSEMETWGRGGRLPHRRRDRARGDREPHGRGDLRRVQGDGQRRAAADARAGRPAHLPGGGHRGERNPAGGAAGGPGHGAGQARPAAGSRGTAAGERDGDVAHS